MADSTKRRKWDVELAGLMRTVVVEYRMISGYMSIFVDGVRAARAWREFQTVFGGAVLGVDLEGHRLEARITQPFGAQEYSFALMVDGQVQPGSDDLPPPGVVKRSTVRTILALALVLFVLTLASTLLRR
jgi:hypothetical protein